MNSLIRPLSIALLCCAGAAASAQHAINVRGTVAAVDGKTLAVATREGSALALTLSDAAKVSGTPMSQAIPGSRADIEPGETTFIAARHEADGTLTAARVQVGTNGIKPTQ
jgi:hypothetical protein